MVNSLEIIFSNLNEKIEILLFIGVILTIMGIIIWFYVVKTKRLLSKLEKKLNDVSSISEKGIKPGLTTITDKTQRKMLNLIKYCRKYRPR